MKKFLQTILLKVKNLFRKAEDEAKKWTIIAIKLTEGLKAVLDSPVDDVFVSILKAANLGAGEFAEKLIQIMKDHLPTSILTLKMLKSIANIEDEQEQLKAILGLFKLSPDVEKNAAYHDFCAKAIYCLADGKLTWSECVYLAQSGYEDFKLGLIK